MLAASIVQDTFDGEAGEGERGGEVETTGSYFYHPAGNSSRFVAIEFLSHITKACFTICRIATSRATSRKSRINFYSSDVVQMSRDSWERF